ncbi:hypothetical protein QBC41DRAFT_301559 [Cercophora samala]|uniref:Uncharacterized protein n=1 Tax=Cercophora samala TaxID=330535 RepID=A0AA40DEA8_9PEZI|nr:hypothetical protein QBC41DRAFT_301559 [Cercophora samala]
MAKFHLLPEEQTNTVITEKSSSTMDGQISSNDGDKATFDSAAEETRPSQPTFEWIVDKYEVRLSIVMTPPFKLRLILFVKKLDLYDKSIPQYVAQLGEHSTKEILLQAIARHPEMKDWIRDSFYQRHDPSFWYDKMWDSVHPWTEKAVTIFSDFDFLCRYSTENSEHGQGVEAIAEKIRELFRDITKNTKWEASYQSKAKGVEVMLEVISMLLYAEKRYLHLTKEIYQSLDGDGILLARGLSRFSLPDLLVFFSDNNCRFKTKFDLLAQQAMERAWEGLDRDPNIDLSLASSIVPGSSDM